MKIQVSLSASVCKKGDRVVVRVKKDEWYIGTVARSGLNVVVDFDDGHEAIIGVKDFKHIKVIAKDAKRRQKFLTDEQAKAIIAKAPTAVKKPAAPKKKESVLPPKMPKEIRDAIMTGKIKPVAVKDMASGKGRMSGFTDLERYLEGEAPSEKWVNDVLSWRSDEQPKVLYRLCLASKNAKVGTTINVTKELVSASDKPKSAIYAGCSFHHDFATNIDDKSLALIEIHNPITLMSLQDILDEIPAHNKIAHERIYKEREYLIKGPLKGKVIEIVPNSFIPTRNYKIYEIPE